MTPEQIANKARKAISRFCIEECKAYCCRKGYLVVNQKELDLLSNGKKEEMVKLNLVKQLKDGKFSYFLGKYDYTCPSLTPDFKCINHKKKNRPLACKEFPVFLDHEKKLIKLSPRCLAVKQGLLYPFTSRLISMGYKVVKPDSLADIELHNVTFL